jgi:hypothetical protein
MCGVQIGFYPLLTFSFGGKMVARDYCLVLVGNGENGVLGD